MNYLYPDYAKWQSRFVGIGIGMVSKAFILLHANIFYKLNFNFSSFMSTTTKSLLTMLIGELFIN
jgi:hypothetical protein